MILMFKFRYTYGWFCEGVTIISFSAFDNVEESDDFCGVSNNTFTDDDILQIETAFSHYEL